MEGAYGLFVAKRRPPPLALPHPYPQGGEEVYHF